MRYIYTLILFIFPFLNQAQGLKPQVPLTYEIQYPSGNKAVKSCANSISPTTAFMLLDYHRFMVGDIPQTEFVAKYGIVIKERTLYINAFIHLNNAESINALISKGVLTRINKGNIITGLIPLNKFEEVLQNNGVRYIDIGNKVESNLDSSKIYTRTDSVHAGYAPLSQSYKGNGVIVGVIDIGFDYTHPNFYDSSGTGGYRIKRVWEQRKTGTPPSGFSYGRELTTQSDILNAKTDLTDQTHGSHVAGISAGAGVNNFNMIGAAPMADIVLVATTMYTTDIADGIEYIEKYAASVGKPCVINMSLGSIFGNHDGTGSFSQLCDNSFVKESNILVVAAGNDGRTSNKVHVNREIKGVSASDSDFYSFISFPGSGIKVNGSTYVDIWGEVGDTFFVGIGVYNKVANSYESFSPFLYGAHIDTFTSITLYDNNPTPIPCYIDIYQGVSSDNSRPRITFAIDNRYQTSANRQLLLYVKSLKKSTINMWTANASAHFVSNGYSNTEDGDSYMTINELATGEKIISVGAYTSKDFWYPYAYPSTSYSYGGNSARGEAAPFTSMGPTLDGRVKPDISAPGTAIVSSYNSYIANASYTNSTTSTIITNMITFGAKSWYYGVMQGTSMATPFATGVIALWLEMYPQLNYKQIKSIFLETALRDSFTGTIPFAGNNVWGQGKINAFVGIVPEKASINPKDTISICPNELNVKLSVNESFEKYEWNTGDSLSFILASNVGWYRVRGINKFGIPGPWSDSVYVIKSDLALNLGNDTIFCHNTFIHLDAKNIGSTYAWSDGSANQTFTANQTGKYWVNVYKDRCMISDTIQITESDLELDLGNDTIFCHNTFIHLDAKNIGSTYTWSDGSANQTFTANQTGKYWVNVYKDRCMISDSIQITESDLELDLGNDTIFCHNTFIHLDAKNIGSTYAWSDGSANQTFTANQTGKYWVNVYKDRCMISDTIQITESDLELDLGNDTIFCHNTFIHLDAKNIGSTYTWSDGSANQTFTANQTGQYWVNVYKDRCMISDSIQITESDLELDLGNDTIFCHNTFIHLDAKNIGSTYTWSDGSANQTFTANQTGKYWVNVYKDRCMISDSIQITESDLELDLGNDTTFCEGLSLMLNAHNTGAAYLWSTNQASQTINVNQTGNYWVRVSKDGCYITDTIDIIVSPLPRAAQIISASLGLCSFGFEIQNPTHVEQYIWDFGDQFRDSSGQSVEHAYRENKHYLVKAIISNACGMKEFQTAVNCSGLDEKNILRLYPNPAQTEITLRINSYEEFFSKITITNSLGQQIYLEDTNLISIANINIGQFSNGVYNVTILTNKGNTYTQKFVKAE